MYSENELKNDLIANLQSEENIPKSVIEKIKNSIFQFNDTNFFTHIEWNTYERNLVIFCSPNDKKEIDTYKKEIFTLCSKIHGTQDSFIIMSLEVIAKSNIISTDNTLTDEYISITSTITIDKANSYVKSGGFGSIYKYYDEIKEKTIAVKIYEPSVFQSSTSETMKKRFIREGKKLHNYSHPNIVKVYDYGFLGDDSAFITMEYISGLNVADYIEKNKPLNDNIINSLCYQYIDGMAYVHSKTDAHRDISYSNVMITESNEVKILDFGFSKNNDDTNYDTEYNDIIHKFALPNENYTLQTEVYCIGAILYTFITGELFNNYNHELINESSCDDCLKQITLKCLQIKPTERFKNATEIKDTLRNTNVIIPVSNFNLDEFRTTIVNTIKLHFQMNYNLNIKCTQKWFEDTFRKNIANSFFQTTINIKNILYQYPDTKKINYSSNISYDCNKTYYIDMFRFYDTLSDDFKQLFINNLHQIISEISIMDIDDLPFT